jgi:hypothetical protein
MGHLMMGGGLAQSAIKAGQLQVQPWAERQMQGIPCPQGRRLGQTKPGCCLEIPGGQRHTLQAMLTQLPKALPGSLGFLQRDRTTAHLQGCRITLFVQGWLVVVARKASRSNSTAHLARIHKKTQLDHQLGEEFRK